MNMKHAALLAVLSLGLGLTACQKKEESTMEKASENVQDALGTRDHEELKDAGEDAKDAVEGAVDGVKEEVKE